MKQPSRGAPDFLENLEEFGLDLRGMGVSCAQACHHQAVLRKDSLAPLCP